MSHVATEPSLAHIKMLSVFIFKFSYSSLHTSTCFQIIRGGGGAEYMEFLRMGQTFLKWCGHFTFPFSRTGKCGLSTSLPTRAWSLFHIRHPRSFSYPAPPALPMWGQSIDIGGTDRLCMHRKQMTAAPDQHQRHFFGLCSGDGPVLCISHGPRVSFLPSRPGIPHIRQEFFYCLLHGHAEQNWEKAG